MQWKSVRFLSGTATFDDHREANYSLKVANEARQETTS